MNKDLNIIKIIMIIKLFNFINKKIDHSIYHFIKNIEKGEISYIKKYE